MVKIGKDVLEYMETKAGRKLTDDEIRDADQTYTEETERWKSAGNNMMSLGCGLTIASLLVVIMLVLIF